MQHISDEFPIRQATVEDRPEIRTLQTTLFPGPHPYSYEMNIGYRDTRNFVALNDHKVVGYISTLVSCADQNGPHLWQRMKPYLAFMGVLPGFQGRGIGTALLHQAMKTVFAVTAAPYFYLECDDKPAGFYLKTGWEPMTPDQVQCEFGLTPKAQVWRVRFRFPSGECSGTTHPPVHES